MLIEQRTQKKKILQHSLCSIFFSAVSSDQYSFFSRSAILQQTFIQIGSSRNFADKAHPLTGFLQIPRLSDVLPRICLSDKHEFPNTYCIFSLGMLSSPYRYRRRSGCRIFIASERLIFGWFRIGTCIRQ